MSNRQELFKLKAYLYLSLIAILAFTSILLYLVLSSIYRISNIPVLSFKIVYEVGRFAFMFIVITFTLLIVIAIIEVIVDLCI
jgi:polyferredoxin